MATIPPLHVAILYRTNAQSRAFEEALRARGMRYRMLGGFSFYQRAEVKDALAYARMAIFPDDDIALLRVINTPPRGIGKTSLDSLSALAREHDTSLWVAIEDMLEQFFLGPCDGSAEGFPDIDRRTFRRKSLPCRRRSFCNPSSPAAATWTCWRSAIRAKIPRAPTT